MAMNIVFVVFLATWILGQCLAALNVPRPAVADAMLGSGAQAATPVQIQQFAQGDRDNVSVADGFALRTAPPSGGGFRPPRLVNLLISGQKTVAPRTTDTLETAHEEKLETVAERVRLREMEDVYFAVKAKFLEQRIYGGPTDPARLALPTTGAEFLDALVAASRRAAITNLVVFGHSASSGLYMLEDRGFYQSVSAAAQKSPLVDGPIAERLEKLRALGARDLGDLDDLVRRGDVKFAGDAVIVFTGCSVAGATEIEPLGIASRMAEITGAVVFASVDLTDGSMAEIPGWYRNVEYSKGTWVRFERGMNPKDLNTKVLDVLERLNLRRFQDGVTRTGG
jgi:hypothetical protein